MDTKTPLDASGQFDPARHEAEVEERWGGTAARRRAARRTAKYSELDWATIRNEAEKITSDFAAHFDAGRAPTNAAVMGVAERHRQHLSRWYYPCPPATHRRLGQMYAADSRFARNYNRVRAGLAAYVGKAIAANAERAERRPSKT